MARSTGSQNKISVPHSRPKKLDIYTTLDPFKLTLFEPDNSHSICLYAQKFALQWLQDNVASLHVVVTLSGKHPHSDGLGITPR